MLNIQEEYREKTPPERIRKIIKEAADDTCICCQGQTLQRLDGLEGWEWFTVDGKHAKIRVGYKISEIRVESISKPGILSNCRFSPGEVAS